MLGNRNTTLRYLGNCRVLGGEQHEILPFLQDSSPGVRAVKLLWLLYALTFLGGQSSLDQPAFTKPSEAYQFARQPLTEWEAALHAHKEPATQTLPADIVQERGKALCPRFSLDSVSGEELYWLAKLCEADHPKALLAVQRYLQGDKPEHGLDARLLLAVLQMRTTRNWEASWPTIRSILKEDPAEAVYSQIDIAIDDEASAAPAKALQWSEERYAILRDRANTETKGASPSSGCMLRAGSDLVHKYYLAEKAEQSAEILDQMNHFIQSQPQEPTAWGAEDLHWANMEMHAAPDITALKVFGGNSGFGLMQRGRVEVFSFFFLGCAPCMRELSELNSVQNRYGKNKLVVSALTTYKLNSYVNPPTDSNIETSVERTRAETAPSLAFVMTTDETLARYGVHGVPVLAIVDKNGRVRYMGREINFEDDDPTGRLIRKLVEE